MIYVYVSGNFVQVLTDTNAHSLECDLCRNYPTTQEALLVEMDPRVRERLREIELDEITASRRVLALQSMKDTKR